MPEICIVHKNAVPSDPFIEVPTETTPAERQLAYDFGFLWWDTYDEPANYAIFVTAVEVGGGKQMTAADYPSDSVEDQTGRAWLAYFAADTGSAVKLIGQQWVMFDRKGQEIAKSLSDGIAAGKAAAA